ncbi:hypothetical protein B484DRAFT_451648 [Ochromonadaceae sp. CCMP2298]|nr:hypothetical protein B484DRAFT_451648 [Ochromonadaceae sp. CCMP2298]
MSVRVFTTIPPRKSVLDCSKWGRFDGCEQEETMHSMTIESHRLIQFLAICKANGVHTVWEACQRWPRLLTTTTVHRGITTSLFPEAMFEQNRRTVYEVQQREAAVSAMNLTFGLPDGIPAMIMAFAQDTPAFQPWTTKLTISRPYEMTAKQMIERQHPILEDMHTHPHPQCWLRGQLRDSCCSSIMHCGTCISCTEAVYEEDIWEAEKFQQPCIHARLGEWIDLYEVAANANVDAEGGEDFILESLQEENDDLRALLHGLLEAMGFETLEAAEEAYPCLQEEERAQYPRVSEGVAGGGVNGGAGSGGSGGSGGWAASASTSAAAPAPAPTSTSTSASAPSHGYNLRNRH